MGGTMCDCNQGRLPCTCKGGQCQGAGCNDQGCPAHYATEDQNVALEAERVLRCAMACLCFLTMVCAFIAPFVV